MSPSITVAFACRDHYSMGAKALRRIRKHTQVPYTLLIIDSNIPQRYRREMEKAVAGMDNVVWRRTGKFLTTFENMNVAFRYTGSADVCFIENDCLVAKGWLPPLLAACEKTGAGVAIPKLWEGPAWRRKIHHDRGFSDIRLETRDGQPYAHITCDPALVRSRARLRVPTVLTTLETHCVFFRRAAIEAIAALDERIVSSIYAELSFKLLQKSIPIVFVPDSIVCHYPPRFIRRDEMDFYQSRWDVEKSLRSVQIVSNKWHTRIPNSTDFVRGQHHRTNPLRWWIYRFGKLSGMIRRRLLPVSQT